MESSKSLTDRQMDGITVGRTSIVKPHVDTLCGQNRETQSDSIARYELSFANSAKGLIDEPGASESD